MTPLILASGSTARRRLLEAAAIPFHPHSPNVDEAAIKRIHREPDAAALALARTKALTVHEPRALVIGADQILVLGTRWFDKPGSLAEARAHLLALRGHRHELVTAVVLMRNGAPLWQHVARPALTMRPWSDAFLDAYLAVEGEALLSTVGAYRAEGSGIQLFSHMEGEHSAILGLPMLPLLAALREHGAIPG